MRSNTATTRRVRLVIVLAVAAAVTVMFGAILVAASVVMRLVTKHEPANMTRLGLDVVATGVVFGLVVLVVFAIARIGTSWKAPAAGGYGGSPQEDRWPATCGGVPRARQVTWARHIAGAPPGPAPRWRPGRRKRSRRA